MQKFTRVFLVSKAAIDQPYRCSRPEELRATEQNIMCVTSEMYYHIQVVLIFI